MDWNYEYHQHYAEEKHRKAERERLAQQARQEPEDTYPRRRRRTHYI